MDGDDTERFGFDADFDRVDRTLGDLTAKASRFGTAMTAALKGAATGGQSLDGVLRGLGQRISAIALDAALKPLGNLAGSAISGALARLGSAIGLPASVPVKAFAKGGVVSAPAFFPTGRQLGLMGEAGAEAILPLKRGADGSMGVALEGGGRRGGSPIVFNVTTPDAASFKRSETQIQAMVARAALRGRRGL